MSNPPQPYRGDFYTSRGMNTRKAAERILDIAFRYLPQVNSMVDLGCGVGVWLAEAKRRGVKEVLGLDGDWVDLALLEIMPEEFRSSDLSKPPTINKRFDLAISLEVAEHLPPETAEDFVSSLTGLSDFVLFSAAIPGQGGVQHINEQWQSYWGQLFRDRGYLAFDIVRPLVWADTSIGFPYRQNMILYVCEARCEQIPATPSPSSEALSIVHPEVYLAANAKSISRSLGDLRDSIRERIIGSK